jgi:hypothetical protein
MIEIEVGDRLYLDGVAGGAITEVHNRWVKVKWRFHSAVEYVVPKSHVSSPMRSNGKTQWLLELRYG